MKTKFHFSWSCRLLLRLDYSQFILIAVFFIISFSFEWFSCSVLTYVYGPWESHLYQLVQHNGNGWMHESPSHPYAQGPKGENVGSITQPLPSNYLIFRAASESDGELFGWTCMLFLVKMNYFHMETLVKVFLSVSKSRLSLQADAGWMPWSWLSVAPASTSAQPKQEEKETSARRQNPPIFSTCCSLLHSLTLSCFSE